MIIKNNEIKKQSLDNYDITKQKLFLLKIQLD